MDLYPAMGFPMGSVVKNLLLMWETRIQSLGQKDPLEEEMATILAGKIPCTEEPGELQSCYCSVTQSCPTLCDPVYCCTPDILSFTTSWSFSNSCPLSRWHHPSISSSVVPFSSSLQSFPASGSFPVRRFFASGGQSIRASASFSVLPMNIQDWFPLGLTDLISLQSKGLPRVFSNTTVQKHQFFSTQPSFWFNSHIHTWLLEKPYLWLHEPLLAKVLLFTMLSTFVIAFLPRAVVYSVTKSQTRLSTSKFCHLINLLY